MTLTGQKHLCIIWVFQSVSKRKNKSRVRIKSVDCIWRVTRGIDPVRLLLLSYSYSSPVALKNTNKPKNLLSNIILCNRRNSSVWGTSKEICSRRWKTYFKWNTFNSVLCAIPFWVQSFNQQLWRPHIFICRQLLSTLWQITSGSRVNVSQGQSTWQHTVTLSRSQKEAI